MSDWKNNPKVPLSFEEQTEVTKELCRFGGVDPMEMAKEGLYVGYITLEVFKAVIDGTLMFGTVCGKKDNVMSAEMAESLSAAEHVVGLMWNGLETQKRGVVCALAVRGFGRRDGKRLEKKASEAGCSLRPDPVKICGKEWILFESE